MHWCRTLLLTACVHYITAKDPSPCQDALGMQSGEIKDSWITASSSYDEASVGPANGRIKTERGGGAWCPKYPVTSNVYEWLQVDLHELYKVTGIESQGRFGNGQGQEFAESYRIEYQRKNESNWIKYRNQSGSEVFDGNMNTYYPKSHDLAPALVAQKIRIIPYSNHPRTVCMRIEVYGCKWSSGLVAYSIPQGERRGSEVDLYDFTYDGDEVNGRLVGGLGLLVDGHLGPENFRVDPLNIGHRGYGWIGWKNDSDHPVELVFTFLDLRNFSEVRIYGNNQFNREVRIFKEAIVSVSQNGQTYGKLITYSYVRDTWMETSRHIIIPLPHLIGRFVKILLTFDAKWIMISEVRFESEAAVGAFTEDIMVVSGLSSTAPPFDLGTTLPWVKDTVLNDRTIGIIIGALAAVIIIIIIIVIIIIVRNRRTTRGKMAARAPAKDTLMWCGEEEIQTRQLPPLPVRYHSAKSDTMTSCDYAVPNDLPPAVPPKPEPWYSMTPYIMWQQLTFIHKLGQGQFGEVHLCQSSGSLVAVKILQHDDELSRTNFLKEIRLMTRLTDPNIVSVVGVCMEPLCMVLEYMKYGDLHQYIMKHQLPDGPIEAGQYYLSPGALTFMAVQVSSGMKYLESLNTVHRDLATRNCLVGDDLTIKISDFGMSRSLYACDYYRIEGKAMLPIRWMSWESVLLGKFSTKSDVWSFAVVLWEIWSLCRLQPFSHLTDLEIIDLCSRGDTTLSRPESCPREVYDLMLQCWSRDDSQRPSFAEIHLFLTMKNCGYQPQHDTHLQNAYNVPLYDGSPYSEPEDVMNLESPIKSCVGYDVAC